VGLLLLQLHRLAWVVVAAAAWTRWLMIYQRQGRHPVRHQPLHHWQRPPLYWEAACRCLVEGKAAPETDAALGTVASRATVGLTAWQSQQLRTDAM
jgi:hypothetical protein